MTISRLERREYQRGTHSRRRECTRERLGPRDGSTTRAGAIPEGESTQPAEGEGRGERVGELRLMYQNVGKGATAAHLLLQLAVEKEAEVVVIAEPWGEMGRRKQPVGYEVAYEARYLVKGGGQEGWRVGTGGERGSAGLYQARVQLEDGTCPLTNDGKAQGVHIHRRPEVQQEQSPETTCRRVDRTGRADGHWGSRVHVNVGLFR